MILLNWFNHLHEWQRLFLLGGFLVLIIVAAAIGLVEGWMLRRDEERDRRLFVTRFRDFKGED